MYPHPLRFDYIQLYLSFKKSGEGVIFAGRSVAVCCFYYFLWGFCLYLSTLADTAAAGACVCPRRDAGAAARARRSPRAEPSTGVVDGPQGGEAREGDASGGCRRRE